MRKHKITPFHKKKRYSKPEITAIKLDPEQALINVCMSLGGYLNAAGNGCYPRGAHTPCHRSNRSRRTGVSGLPSGSAAPS